MMGRSRTVSYNLAATARAELSAGKRRFKFSILQAPFGECPVVKKPTGEAYQTPRNAGMTASTILTLCIRAPRLLYLSFAFFC
jgi:hypothetical protein